MLRQLKCCQAASSNVALSLANQKQSKANANSFDRAFARWTTLSGASERFRSDSEAFSRRYEIEFNRSARRAFVVVFFFQLHSVVWECESERNREREWEWCDKEGAPASFEYSVRQDERIETKRIGTKREETRLCRTFLGAIGARTSPRRTETRWPLTEWQRSPENRLWDWRIPLPFFSEESRVSRIELSYRIESDRLKPNLRLRIGSCCMLLRQTQWRREWRRRVLFLLLVCLVTPTRIDPRECVTETAIYTHYPLINNWRNSAREKESEVFRIRANVRNCRKRSHKLRIFPIHN